MKIYAAEIQKMKTSCQGDVTSFSNVMRHHNNILSNGIFSLVKMFGPEKRSSLVWPESLNEF